MADPSMDRQEFYVAASRTRGETFFYATPEVGFDRVEFAPSAPESQGLEHIARAAERDGSQAAAHDAALRERLGQLSTPELFTRHRELASEAGAERYNEHRRGDLERRLADLRGQLERFARQRDELGREPPVWARTDRAVYRGELVQLEVRARHAERNAARLEAELAGAAAVQHAARAERAVVDFLIDEWIRARLTAVRLDPPPYIVAELGQRPSEIRERLAWDSGAEQIERYRAEHGIRDRDNAFGPEPKRSDRNRERETQRQRLAHQQRLLRQVREQAQKVEVERGFSLER
jgi:hypothetical protein